jgi:hypothetical protein
MFSRRQFLPSVQSPEFRPQHVFVARNSLTEPLVLGPRVEHCLQTESIRVFHVLVQSCAERPIAQKDQSDLFHEAKKVDLVFRRDFNLDRRRDRSVVGLRQVRRVRVLVEWVRLLIYLSGEIDGSSLRCECTADSQCAC